MTGQSWARSTGVAMPECKMQGCCCRAASPSIPFHQLFKKSAEGDDFARNFFSIFIPYPDSESAGRVVPGLVERALRAARKDSSFKGEEDVQFYHCRFIGEDNRCLIWEDRPKLCRDYPDSPFLIFAPNCAFEPWAIKVKEKFSEMKKELEQLKALKSELSSLSEEGIKYTKIDAIQCSEDNLFNLSLVLSLTSLYIVSPVGSCYPKETL